MSDRDGNKGRIVSTKGIVCGKCGDVHVPGRASLTLRAAGPGEIWCDHCGKLVKFVTHLSWETIDVQQDH